MPSPLVLQVACTSVRTSSQIAAAETNATAATRYQSWMSSRVLVMRPDCHGCHERSLIDTITKLAEMSLHAVGIGASAGEQVKGLNGLEDSHASTIHGATSQRSCCVKQFGVGGEVNDIRNPQRW